ncbi:MAG: amidophosphoribosyltransferase [Sphaerochaetaceae bacterium]|jgi:amidophosphoribosyltransferase
MSNFLHEECGLFGISSKEKESVSLACHYGLYALQHRGQQGCGIAFNTAGELSLHKDLGLVSEVFTSPLEVDEKQTRAAIAHTSYARVFKRPRQNVQPLMFQHHSGSLVIAHNGALTNAEELRFQFEGKGSLFHTSSDAELIAYLIYKYRSETATIQEAVEKAVSELQGAFSVIIMTPEHMVALRDPHGFRPLCVGKLEDGYVFASESCALDAVGATFERDIAPGEICIVDLDDQSFHTSTIHTKKVPQSLCAFELIYFSRPDSVIDSISIHQARIRSGALLALEHPAQADVVIGVPDSGIDAAIGYARQSGIPYGIGFIKNKYIGRIFIQNQAQLRERTTHIKLNPISATVKGKRVVLVDDSIVRGTTSRIIIRLLREAGATEVHLRFSAPPFIFPCYYGTDIKSQKDLFAYKYDHQQMQDILDVESLGFLPPEQLAKLSPMGDIGLCSGCFTGNYPTDVGDDHDREF